MWSVYLKIAYRTLTINKFYTFINIFGLSVGIASGLMILLYLQNEFSYDTYLPDYERIYRISIDFKTEDETRQMAIAHPVIADELMNGFENVEAVTKLLPTEGTILNRDSVNLFSTDIFFADSSFFKVFKHYAIYSENDLTSALSDTNSIVLTASFARQIFGDTLPLNPIVNIRSTNLFQYDGTYKVTAVIHDPPENTQLPFKALISWKSDDRFVKMSWVYTYFLLNETNDIWAFKENWWSFYKKYLEDKQLTKDFHLFNIRDIHLRSDLSAEPYPVGNVNYLYIFLIVAVFIIAVACINYINMTTVRYAQRMKEVGVRKALGSDRETLMKQFLIESAILTFISFFVALSIVEVMLPYFNTVTNKTLTLSDLRSTQLLYVLEGLFVSVVLLAGVYPAFYLSGLRPIQALKGNLKAGRGALSFRKLLVVTQFVITIITLVGTGIVYQQLEFVRNRDLGLQKANIMVIRLPQNGLIHEKIDKIKKYLLKSPDIYKIGNAVDIPGGNLPLQFLEVERKEGEMSKQQLGRMIINSDFLETLDIQIVKGRNFDRNIEEDYQESILINEAASEYLCWGDGPIGKKVVISRDAEGNPVDERHVIGVVKNFHYSSLHTPISPIFMVLSRRVGNLFLNIEGNNLKDVLEHLEKVWTKIVPEEPLSYFLLDENFQEHYLAEEKLGKLLGYFSILTIIISCLGLLGLASYAAEVRTKEIGIRKVLGASIVNLILLLSKDFARLIVIAVLLATPLGYYFITQWLNNFAYKTEIQWYIFLMAGIMALMAAIFPLVLQAIRTALQNPIKALRTE